MRLQRLFSQWLFQEFFLECLKGISLNFLRNFKRNVRKIPITIFFILIIQDSFRKLVRKFHLEINKEFSIHFCSKSLGSVSKTSSRNYLESFSRNYFGNSFRISSANHFRVYQGIGAEFTQEIILGIPQVNYPRSSSRILEKKFRNSQIFPRILKKFHTGSRHEVLDEIS